MSEKLRIWQIAVRYTGRAYSPHHQEYVNQQQWMWVPITAFTRKAAIEAFLKLRQSHGEHHKIKSITCLGDA